MIGIKPQMGTSSGGGGGSVSQDNKPTITVVSFDYSNASIADALAAGVNNSATHVVADIDIQHYLGVPRDTRRDVTRPVVTHRFRVKKGKGTYGVGGTAISSGDIDIISSRESIVEDIASLPNTQTLTWGNVNPSGFLNGQNPAIELIDPEDGAVLVITDTGNYIFQGGGGFWGVGAQQSDISMFFPLNDAPNTVNVFARPMKEVTGTHPYVYRPVLEDASFLLYISRIQNIIISPGLPVGTELVLQSTDYNFGISFEEFAESETINEGTDDEYYYDTVLSGEIVGATIGRIGTTTTIRKTSEEVVIDNEYSYAVFEKWTSSQSTDGNEVRMPAVLNAIKENVNVIPKVVSVSLQDIGAHNWDDFVRERLAKYNVGRAKTEVLLFDVFDNGFKPSLLPVNEYPTLRIYNDIGIFNIRANAISFFFYTVPPTDSTPKKYAFDIRKPDGNYTPGGDIIYGYYDVTTTSINGLKHDTLYHLRIYMQFEGNVPGRSEYFEKEFRTGPLLPPDFSTYVEVVSITPTSALLRFNEVPGAEGYRIDVGKGSMGNLVINNMAHATNYVPISGLEPETDYIVRVRSVATNYVETTISANSLTARFRTLWPNT